MNELISDHHIDCACVGIGENGYIAFNDHPANFETEPPFWAVELDEGWFPALEAVPRKAIRHVIEGEICPDVPASILRTHEDCHFLLDEAAASLLK